MTQTRTDIQVGQLRDAANTGKAFDGVRPTITVHREEIVCTTEEVEGTSSDLLSLRAAVRRVHDAEDAFDNTMGDCMVPEDVKMALILAYRRNRAALRAEMAGIDGGKEQKP